MRILIVEDDRKLAHQLKTGMEEQGHAVAAVADVMEGLEAARRGGFDVLVLEVCYPASTGFQS
jgi:two-component system, OmpR family, response regulator